MCDGTDKYANSLWEVDGRLCLDVVLLACWQGDHGAQHVAGDNFLASQVLAAPQQACSG